MALGILYKAAAVASLFVSQVWAVSYNGLAITPQMGWVFCIFPRQSKDSSLIVYRIIGMRLDAMSVRRYYWEQPKRLSTTA